VYNEFVRFCRFNIDKKKIYDSFDGCCRRKNKLVAVVMSARVADSVPSELKGSDIRTDIN
jgi:hypothetical protein